MGDDDCVRFLQWCLPQLHMRWAGYRKVRRTVCKRVRRRVRELGLEDLAAYRGLLEESPEEWRRLDSFCRIPISRFYRDRQVFRTLAQTVLPELAQRAQDSQRRELHCWSAGCASGEEPYSLRIAWLEGAARSFPNHRLAVLASDADEGMLARARRGCYGSGSLKDLPHDDIARAFAETDGEFCLRPEFTADVQFVLQDLREAWPAGPFDLILCRNLAFTYFDRALQLRVFAALDQCLHKDGYLVIGSHEKLPNGAATYVALGPNLPIYRRVLQGNEGSA